MFALTNRKLLSLSTQGNRTAVEKPSEATVPTVRWRVHDSHHATQPTPPMYSNSTASCYEGRISQARAIALVAQSLPTKTPAATQTHRPPTTSTAAKHVMFQDSTRKRSNLVNFKSTAAARINHAVRETLFLTSPRGM